VFDTDNLDVRDGYLSRFFLPSARLASE